MKRTIKVRWTDTKGQPVTKRISYPDDYTEAEVVAHVVRTHDPYHSPDDINVEEA
jgi:hypothetical protein